ncbi:MAG TPA: DUF2934 domain-containing protein [Acidiferrobacter sp.]|nr:DUF2934 domain-containing protein [Acidiferrobacter sp.]
MDQELRAMVAETAYFLAEERGFVGDGAFGDWLKAEELVQRRLRQSPGTKLGHPASRKK